MGLYCIVIFTTKSAISPGYNMTHTNRASKKVIFKVKTEGWVGVFQAEKPAYAKARVAGVQ